MEGRAGGFGFQLGWGFIFLEPLIYGKKGGCFEGESLFPEVSLCGNLRERRP